MQNFHSGHFVFAFRFFINSENRRDQIEPMRVSTDIFRRSSFIMMHLLSFINQDREAFRTKYWPETTFRMGSTVLKTTMGLKHIVCLLDCTWLCTRLIMHRMDFRVHIKQFWSSVVFCFWLDCFICETIIALFQWRNYCIDIVMCVFWNESGVVHDTRIYYMSHLFIFNYHSVLYYSVKWHENPMEKTLLVGLLIGLSTLIRPICSWWVCHLFFIIFSFKTLKEKSFFWQQNFSLYSC